MKLSFQTVYRDRNVLLQVSRNPPAWKIQVRPAANVLPVNPDGTILLMHEYKASVGRWIWGFPGGIIEQGESPAQAAKRECEEELGLRVARTKKIMTVRTDFPDTAVMYFLGFGLQQSTAKGWEKIGHVKPVTIDRLFELAVEGKIQDPRMVVAILNLHKKVKQRKIVLKEV